MRELTRRQFVEKAVATASVAAIAPAAAAVAFESQKQSGSANERLSVAVIGVRDRGGDHARAYSARKDCVVSYICDADSAIGERVASQFAGKPKYVADMRRVFEDKTVDVVSIATPNHWHALAAIWAMQAGKDVYVEKPVSHNISEGRRIVQVSRKYDRICQAGTQHRSAGTIRAAAEYVRQGKLGQVRLARVCTYRPRRTIGPAGAYSPPPTVDYGLWAGPAPMEMPVRRKRFHYDWHWFWNWGNGELGNNSVHVVDMMRMIAGLKGLGRGVISYGARLGMQDDCAETPSVQVTIHDFGPTTVVQEVRNLKTPGPVRGSVYIVGAEGYIANGTVYDPKGNVVRKLQGPNLNHFDNFIEAVRSRRRDGQNAEIVEGHTSTAVVHAANISQRLGKPASMKDIERTLAALRSNENAVETFGNICRHLADNGLDLVKTPLALGPWLDIDPERERFTNSAAANAMLTREYRKGFEVPGEGEI